jgi:hypothetical protein
MWWLVWAVERIFSFSHYIVSNNSTLASDSNETDLRITVLLLFFLNYYVHVKPKTNKVHGFLFPFSFYIVSTAEVHSVHVSLVDRVRDE